MNRAAVFSRQFLDMPATEIAEALRTTGYVAVEGALDPAVADAILADVDDLRFEINRNAPPNVMVGAQTYANHIFARSRAAFDLVVSERVLGILGAGLGDSFRIVGKRVYETGADHYMPFHSDVGKPCTDARRLDAIVFIFYLNDVFQGEWEIVENSHLWGERTVGSRADDAALLARSDVKVRGLQMPKGSVVIYNGRLLHRARRFKDKAYRRRSFFFQTNRDAKGGEPMLVDASFIQPDLAPEARMLLGFGSPSIVPSYPASSPQTLPIAKDDDLARYLTENLPVEQLAALAGGQGRQ